MRRASGIVRGARGCVYIGIFSAPNAKCRWINAQIVAAIGLMRVNLRTFVPKRAKPRGWSSFVNRVSHQRISGTYTVYVPIPIHDLGRGFAPVLLNQGDRIVFGDENDPAAVHSFFFMTFIPFSSFYRFFTKILTGFVRTSSSGGDETIPSPLEGRATTGSKIRAVSLLG